MTTDIGSAVDSAARANGFDERVRTADRTALATLVETVRERTQTLRLKSKLDSIRVVCGGGGTPTAATYEIQFTLVADADSPSTSIAQICDLLNRILLGVDNRFVNGPDEVLYSEKDNTFRCAFHFASLGTPAKLKAAPIAKKPRERGPTKTIAKRQAPQTALLLPRAAKIGKRAVAPTRAAASESAETSHDQQQQQQQQPPPQQYTEDADFESADDFVEPAADVATSSAAAAASEPKRDATGLRWWNPFSWVFGSSSGGNGNGALTKKELGVVKALEFSPALLSAVVET